MMTNTQQHTINGTQFQIIQIKNIFGRLQKYHEMSMRTSVLWTIYDEDKVSLNIGDNNRTILTHDLLQFPIGLNLIKFQTN